MPEEDLTKRRAVNACRRCKQRKVKCSGTAPCVNCTNRNQSCIFEEADRKIVISERHLRALERRAALRARSLQEANEIPSAIGREHIEQNVSGSESRCTETTNPQHVSGYIFSRELNQALATRTNTLSDNLVDNIRPPYTFSINEDCQNYPSTLGLPQHDYVIYLTGIVNFHLHSNCLFYNHTVSYNNIDRPPRTLEKTPSLRYANVFAIVALGKLLLERGATSFGPPGIEEFIQSVKALPSSVFLCQEPPLAIETLCILAIYAQAADKHIAAYLYVSQAISIARSCQFDKNENLVNGRNPNERQITQRLWWTACVLDQRLSIMIHASPNCSIEENVEHLLSNEETSVADVALLINLSLGYRSARAMTIHPTHSIRGAENLMLNERIVEELLSLRPLGQKINSIPQFRFDRSLRTMSKLTATVHLLYCHHIMIVAHPVILNVFMSHQLLGSCSEATPESIITIIRICINAAILSINIIAALHKQHLLEMYLFFNIEITFLAALSYRVGNAILSRSTQPDLMNVANEVFQCMIRSGNLAAIPVEAKLKRVGEILSGINPSSNDISFAEKAATMAQDGESLNHAFVNLIDILNAPRQLNCEPETSVQEQMDISSNALETQWSQTEAQETQAATRIISNTPPPVVRSNDTVGPLEM